MDTRAETAAVASARSGSAHVDAAVQLMAGFAARTGLVGDAPGRRYLWTDAFAVCNWLGLARTTGDASLQELALELVAAVHHTLGRHRLDDPRRGWLGDADEGNPTRGGLRIGKPLPERAASEAPDERQEWQRDGQYFHYLTRWMHALRAVGHATQSDVPLRWARELALTAHRAFSYRPRPGARLRMVWKMSIDLTRPLVASMGQHDALDGLVTCLELASEPGADAETRAALRAALAEYATMIEPSALVTTDPLGLGGLLVDACRLATLVPSVALPDGAALLEVVLAAAAHGLRRGLDGATLSGPAAGRLAFRELGLAIGLAAIERLRGNGPATGVSLNQLLGASALRNQLIGFWLDPSHRQSAGYQDHADINDVMLATSLCPDGYLDLG